MERWATDDDIGRRRRDLQEHHRFQVLRRIHECCGDDPCAEVVGPDLARALRLPLEEVFRILEFLARNDYIHYLGAGPRVRIAKQGKAYLTEGRGRRRTVRDSRRTAA